MTTEVHVLETRPPDREAAKKFKDRLASALDVACEVITEAKREGITLSFQVGQDAMGRSFVTALVATKEL